MKIRYYQLLSLVLLLFASCSKDLPDVSTPSLEVQTGAATYKAGDVINFGINTNANIVSFYSGEPLFDFGFRDARVVDISGAGLKMSFTSGISGAGTQGGTASATVPTQLTVLASTNFNGNYDYASVIAATWTDITSRFRYGTTATFAASGNIDISDLSVAGKPLYIAYKYVTKPQTTNGAARTWQIESFVLTSNKDVGVPGSVILPTITNQVSAGFRIVDQNPVTAPAQSTINATRITLLGNLFTPTNDPQSENWAVSRAINLSTLDLGGDKSIAIKDQAKSTALTSYTYSYVTPGTYTATFVGTNVNIKDKKEVVKQIKLTITP